MCSKLFSQESLSHCRKPACMFECKCPPKQPKPDIPKVRGRKKKKANRGMKKGPEKQEMVSFNPFPLADTF